VADAIVVSTAITAGAGRDGLQPNHAEGIVR